MSIYGISSINQNMQNSRSNQTAHQTIPPQIISRLENISSAKLDGLSLNGKLQMLLQSKKTSEKPFSAAETIAEMDIPKEQKSRLLCCLEQFGFKDSFRFSPQQYSFYIKHVIGDELFNNTKTREDFQKYFIDGYNAVFKGIKSTAKMFSALIPEQKILPVLLKEIDDFNDKIKFLSSGDTLMMPEYYNNYTENSFMLSFLLKYFSEKKQLPDVIERKAFDKIEQFSHIENSNNFFSILQERDYKDAAEAVSIIESRLKSCKNEQETAELKNTITRLLSAKTPDGRYIFTSLAASDTETKGMMDGIENFLRAKDNDSAKYNQLMQYLELTEKGVLPVQMLSVLFKNSEIVPEVSSAVDNPENIKIFKNKADAFENSKHGSVIETEGKLYYRNKKNLEPLKMDKKMFEKLFPKIGSLIISQGALGDCYLCSALYDLINNPNTKGKIYQMFEQNGNDIKITIPDMKESPVLFKDAQIDENDNQHIFGGLGIRMLEHAYYETRMQKYSSEGGKLSIAGGKQAQVYNVLLDTKNTDNYSISIKEEDFKTTAEDLEKEIKSKEEYIQKTKQYLEGNKDNPFAGLIRIFGLNSSYGALRFLQENKENLETVKKHTHKVSDGRELVNILKSLPNTKDYLIAAGSGRKADDMDRGIHSGHAYSVYKIDKDNEQIYLINPWNTVQYVKVSFDEFAEYFSDVDVLDLNNL